MQPHHLTYDLPVDARLPDGRIVHCRSHDIDNIGITIKCPYTSSVGDLFKLHFHVLVGSTPHAITTEGVVTLSYLTGEDNLFHTHLRFKSLDPQQLRYLEAFIHERTRD